MSLILVPPGVLVMTCSRAFQNRRVQAELADLVALSQLAVLIFDPMYRSARAPPSAAAGSSAGVVVPNYLQESENQASAQRSAHGARGENRGSPMIPRLTLPDKISYTGGWPVYFAVPEPQKFGVFIVWPGARETLARCHSRDFAAVTSEIKVSFYTYLRLCCSGAHLRSCCPGVAR